MLQYTNIRFYTEFSGRPLPKLGRRCIHFLPRNKSTTAPIAAPAKRKSAVKSRTDSSSRPVWRLTQPHIPAQIRLMGKNSRPGNTRPRIHAMGHHIKKRMPTYGASVIIRTQAKTCQKKCRQPTRQPFIALTLSEYLGLFSIVTICKEPYLVSRGFANRLFPAELCELLISTFCP